MRTVIRLLLPVVPLLLPLCALRADATPESTRSPVNQVFQFVESGTCSLWTDGTATKSTAYLWIPEKCRKLRGLLILCANVPEHMLAGHAAIRDVCTRQDLGIVWCAQTFYNFRAKNEGATDVKFLQQLLDGLAKTSGYDEVATVPWVPIGESGHLLMVDALVENAPERCIAGIWLKNCHLPPHNRETPALVIYGVAQEWSQDKSDIRLKWASNASGYDGVVHDRKAHPAWPLTFLIDGASGHFDCSERLTRYVARYIDLVTKARLATDGSLRPLDLAGGYLADLPVPGHERRPVIPAADAKPEALGLPWFIDQASAEEAQSIANINWKADTQLPGFADETGAVFPFTFNGISWMPMSKPAEPVAGLGSPTIQPEADGITFTVKGVMLDKIPSNFMNAGEPLKSAPGTPSVEWLCGCVEPLGGDKFRLAIDRNWPSPIYLAVRQAGTDAIRPVVQPGQISRDGGSEGAPQKITFDKIDDVKAGTASIQLSAKSDAGLPVRFFVVQGPAIIKESALVFTEIPPRAKLPLRVTVGAWQWGRPVEPKIRRADIVRQSFQIVP